MSYEDPFVSIDPLGRLQAGAQTPMLPSLTKEEGKRLDESYLDTFNTKQHTEKQEKRDTHLMYGMIDLLEERKCRHKRRNATKRTP